MECQTNLVEYGCRIRVDLRCRETQNANIQTFNHTLSFSISLDLLCMNTAIDLNRQPVFRAVEIADEPSDRHLATKLGLCYLPIAQPCP